MSRRRQKREQEKLLDGLSPVEERSVVAFAELSSSVTLKQAQMLLKILSNVRRDPTADKFRRIKKHVAVSRLGEGGLVLLRMLGFVEVDGEVLFLPRETWPASGHAALLGEVQARVAELERPGMDEQRVAALARLEARAGARAPVLSGALKKQRQEEQRAAGPSDVELRQQLRDLQDKVEAADARLKVMQRRIDVVERMRAASLLQQATELGAREPGHAETVAACIESVRDGEPLAIQQAAGAITARLEKIINDPFNVLLRRCNRFSLLRACSPCRGAVDLLFALGFHLDGDHFVLRPTVSPDSLVAVHVELVELMRRRVDAVMPSARHSALSRLEASARSSGSSSSSSARKRPSRTSAPAAGTPRVRSLAERVEAERLKLVEVNGLLEHSTAHFAGLQGGLPANDERTRCVEAHRLEWTITNFSVQSDLLKRYESYERATDAMGNSWGAYLVKNRDSDLLSLYVECKTARVYGSPVHVTMHLSILDCVAKHPMCVLGGEPVRLSKNVFHPDCRELGWQDFATRQELVELGALDEDKDMVTVRVDMFIEVS